MRPSQPVTHPHRCTRVASACKRRPGCGERRYCNANGTVCCNRRGRDKARGRLSPSSCNFSGNSSTAISLWCGRAPRFQKSGAFRSAFGMCEINSGNWCVTQGPGTDVSGNGPPQAGARLGVAPRNEFAGPLGQHLAHARRVFGPLVRKVLGVYREMVGCQVKAGTRAVGRRQGKGRVVRAVKVRKTLVWVTVLADWRSGDRNCAHRSLRFRARHWRSSHVWCCPCQTHRAWPDQTPAAGGWVSAVNVTVVKVLARVVGSTVEAIHGSAENLGKVVPF